MNNPVPAAPAAPAGPQPTGNVTPAMTAAAAGQSGGTAVTFSSMADFKNKQPKVYNKMMQGIGMAMCNQLKAQSDQIVQAIRQGEIDAQED